MPSLDVDAPGTGYEFDDFEERLGLTVVSPDYIRPSPGPWLERHLGWQIVLSASSALLWEGRYEWPGPRRPQRPRPCRTDTEVGALFKELKEDWETRTAAQPAMSRFMDSAYQRIIGLGLQVLPDLLDELSREPSPQWFWALTAIVGQDRAVGCTSVQDALDAWIEWAEAEGYTS